MADKQVAPPGFKNLGQTCSMSTICQVLYSLAKFRSIVGLGDQLHYELPSIEKLRSAFASDHESYKENLIAALKQAM